VEAIQTRESELNKIVIPANETKVEQSNELSVPDLISTLNGIKTEEQELLREREHLQKEENELRSIAITQIDEKKRALKGLKSEVMYLQNKCNELEQALGVPVYR